MKIQKFYIFCAVAVFSIAGCYKDERTCFDEIPLVPYTTPVWHPDGQIIGFNRSPLKSVSKSEEICSGYSYTYYSDSNGFWLVNKDGSNMRRVTTFQLSDPAWSIDGKWIAFCNGGTMFKMAFNGYSLDTAHIITLTANGGMNFFPSWSFQSDTIYYDSDAENTAKPYRIHKMAANGSGQKLIGNKGIDTFYSRESYCTNDNKILHIRSVNNYLQIFSMDTNGDDVLQITYDTLNSGESVNSTYNHTKEFPRLFNDRIYYESNGIYSVNKDGSGRLKLCSASTQNFSISKDGIIAFINFDYSKIDKSFGTVWLMDTEGNNKKQLTSNNY